MSSPKIDPTKWSTRTNATAEDIIIHVYRPKFVVYDTQPEQIKIENCSSNESAYRVGQTIQ